MKKLLISFCILVGSTVSVPAFAGDCDLGGAVVDTLTGAAIGVMGWDNHRAAGIGGAAGLAANRIGCAGRQSDNYDGGYEEYYEVCDDTGQCWTEEPVTRQVVQPVQPRSRYYDDGYSPRYGSRRGMTNVLPGQAEVPYCEGRRHYNTQTRMYEYNTWCSRQ